MIFGISLVFLIVLLIYKLVMPGVAVGWTSLIGAMFLLSGLNIGIVGVVGLYVGNIFDEAKNRPLYVVARVLNDAMASVMDREAQ